MTPNPGTPPRGAPDPTAQRRALWRPVRYWAGVGMAWSFLALALLLSGTLDNTPGALRQLLFWYLGFMDPLRDSGEWASPGLEPLLYVVGPLIATVAGACFGALVGLARSRLHPPRE